MSLTGALLATLLQQWTRRYIKNTQLQGRSPEGRARMRAFFDDGKNNGIIPLPVAVEALPALLHLSLFLFFAGLLVFLFNITGTHNHTLFIVVTPWVAFSLLIYGCITFTPIRWLDSPYYSPFSPVAWFLYTIMGYLWFSIRICIARCCCEPHAAFEDLQDRYQSRMLQGIGHAVNDAVLARRSKLDRRILEWILDTLSGEDSMQRLFQSIPRFFRLKLMNDLEIIDFPLDLATRFMDRLHGFLSPTFSPSSLSGPDINRRLRIYREVMNVIPGPPIDSQRLDDILIDHRIETETIETGQTLARWIKKQVPSMVHHAQKRVDGVLAALPENGRDALQNYINHQDNSVSLYLLNQAIRQAIDTGSFEASKLPSLSRSDIRNTLPRLQHEFCRLWNIIGGQARDQGPHSTPAKILDRIHHLYITLRPDIDAEPTQCIADTGDDHVQNQPRSHSEPTFPHHVDPVLFSDRSSLPDARPPV